VCPSCVAIQKAQMIVDSPCNEMHTDAFIEVRIFSPLVLLCAIVCGLYTHLNMEDVGDISSLCLSVKESVLEYTINTYVYDPP